MQDKLLKLISRHSVGEYATECKECVIESNEVVQLFIDHGWTPPE